MANSNGQAQITRGQIATDDEIDLGQVLQTLWRGKWVIALCAVLFLLLGAYNVFFRAVPVYTATAALALESREEQIVDIESVVTGLGGDQATVNTEIEVLRSRGLITDLVEDMGLVEDPEFNPEIRDKSGLSIGNAVKWVKGTILRMDTAQGTAGDLRQGRRERHGHDLGVQPAPDICLSDQCRDRRSAQIGAHGQPPGRAVYRRPDQR